jgi:hypothetical protein
MRTRTFPAEGGALLDAEAVLFVDDGESQVIKCYAFLN